MAASVPSSGNESALTSELKLAVYWEISPERSPGPAPLEFVRPPAQEIASVFLGLDEVYRTIAVALGYPPHFVKVVSVSNPDLKLSLEGGKEAIDALRELIFALPRFVASLFRPQVAWQLAGIEAEVQKKKLEAEAANAATAAAQAEVGRLKAELDAAKFRQELAAIPIAADPEGHALLLELVRQMQATDIGRRPAFLADAALYLVATRGYQPSSRVALVPIEERPATLKRATLKRATTR